MKIYLLASSTALILGIGATVEAGTKESARQRCSPVVEAFAKAEALLEVKQYSEAINILDTLKHGTTELNVEEKFRIEQLLSIGQREVTNSADAKQILLAALKNTEGVSNESIADAHSGVALLAEDDNLFSEAISHLKTAATLKPDEWSYPFRVGNIYLKWYIRDDAVDFADPHLLKESKRYIEQGLKLCPSPSLPDPDVVAKIDELMKSPIAVKENNLWKWKVAFDYRDKALRTLWNYRDSGELGELEAAVDLLYRAQQSNPNIHKSVDKLAEELESLLRRAPGNSDYFRHQRTEIFERVLMRPWHELLTEWKKQLHAKSPGMRRHHFKVAARMFEDFIVRLQSLLPQLEDTNTAFAPNSVLELVTSLRIVLREAPAQSKIERAFMNEWDIRLRMEEANALTALIRKRPQNWKNKLSQLMKIADELKSAHPRAGNSLSWRMAMEVADAYALNPAISKAEVLEWYELARRDLNFHMTRVLSIKEERRSMKDQNLLQGYGQSIFNYLEKEIHETSAQVPSTASSK